MRRRRGSAARARRATSRSPSTKSATRVTPSKPTPPAGRASQDAPAKSSPKTTLAELFFLFLNLSFSRRRSGVFAEKATFLASLSPESKETPSLESALSAGKRVVRRFFFLRSPGVPREDARRVPAAAPRVRARLVFSKRWARAKRDFSRFRATRESRHSRYFAQATTSRRATTWTRARCARCCLSATTRAFCAGAPPPPSRRRSPRRSRGPRPQRARHSRPARQRPPRRERHSEANSARNRRSLGPRGHTSTLRRPKARPTPNPSSPSRCLWRAASQAKALVRSLSQEKRVLSLSLSLSLSRWMRDSARARERERGKVSS